MNRPSPRPFRVPLQRSVPLLRRIPSLPAGLLIAAAILTAGSLTGCAGSGPATGPIAGTTGSSAAPAARGTAPSVAAAPAQRAVSRVPALAVRVAPAATAALVTRLSATTSLGSARVLLVDPAGPARPGWVHVWLPVRPNGSSGWVAAADVLVQPIGDRIAIDTAARRLRLWLGGRPVLDVPIAVGASGTPTPLGRFYVTDRVRPPDPHGAYGPFALGLSAHSPTLQSFGDGDAQIGIHGTDQAGSIGHPVTHGCIRMPNAAAALLAEVPLGTPVTVG